MPEHKGEKTVTTFWTKLIWTQKCASVNFSNWSSTPKTWMILGVMAVFGIWNLSGVLRYSAESGIRCSMWLYPHYFSVPIMYLVYGFLTIALFSEVPYHSPFSDFLKIRTGARIWIFGQCLFVAEASFCYSLAYFLMTVIIILPRIIVMNRWGKLIETLAYNPEAAGNISGISFSADIIRTYSPIQATVLTFIFVWLVSCFLGMLIMMCRILIGGHAGDAFAGFFVFLSYFSVFVGSMIFGTKIFKFSPVSWINLALFRPNDNFPDVTYGLLFLVLGILLFGAVGSVFYVRGRWKE